MVVSGELLSSTQSFKFCYLGYLDGLLSALYKKAKRQQRVAFEHLMNK